MIDTRETPFPRGRPKCGHGHGLCAITNGHDMKKAHFFLVAISLFFTVVTSSIAQSRKARVDERVLYAELRLSALGYWITNVDGMADSSTRHAVVAFQKVEGLKRTGAITETLVSALENASRPAAKHTSGRHIEIDIGRQVLFIVDEQGMVERILPVSTGNEKPYYEKGKRLIAHTQRGSFKIYRQIKGVRHAPLGTLYYPNYFSDGVAIHGSDSVPAYPASHGCVRIPRFSEREFSRIVWVGMAVYVYD